MKIYPNESAFPYVEQGTQYESVAPGLTVRAELAARMSDLPDIRDEIFIERILGYSLPIYTSHTLEYLKEVAKAAAIWKLIQADALISELNNEQSH